MAITVGTAVLTGVLSSVINPIVTERVKKLMNKNKPNYVPDLALRLARSDSDKVVDEVQGVLDEGKLVPTGNLTELFGTLVAIEITQDLVDYILKNNINIEENTTSELKKNLDELMSKLKSLRGEPSGESSCMKEGNQPKNGHSSQEKKAEELPRDLMRCLLYFSLFPDGYVLNWKRISRLLIAHDFIEEKNLDSTLKRHAEEWLLVAERSKNEVPCRSMITKKEVLEWPERTFFGELLGRGQKNTIVQRHIIDAREGNIQKNSQENYLRSLIFLGKNGENFDFKNREFMLLRVLSLRNVNLQNENDLKNLSVLRYLDLKYTDVRSCGWLEGLEELRMLDLRFTLVEEIPDQLLQKLTNLQHLLLGYSPKEGAKRLAGAKINTEKLHTENLQTLRAIRPPDMLTMLHKVVDLFITGLKTDQMQALWKSVETLKNLKFLGVAVADKSFTLPDPGSKLNGIYERLQKLHIEGKLSGTQKEKSASTSDKKHPELWKLSAFTDLTDLTLASPIPIDSIPSLPKLLCLRLYGVSKEKELSFKGEGFEKLTKLVIADMKKLKSIEVGSGVMNRLTTVKLRDLPQLTEIVSLEETGNQGVSRVTILRIHQSQENCTVLRFKHIQSLKSIFLKGFKAAHVQRSRDAPNVYCYDTNYNCYIAVSSAQHNQK